MAPTIGPANERNPPSTVMNTISPENVQCMMSGIVSPFSGTHKTPASPMNTPETTNATQQYNQIRTPTNWTRVSLSQIAWSAMPNNEFTMTHMSATQTQNAIST